MRDYIEVQSEKDFSSKACEYIFTIYQQNIAKKNSFSIALTGGETPKNIFSLLLADYKNKIDWSKVHFYWVDERCVPPDHILSNFKTANDMFISKLDNIGSINRIEGELSAELARANYQKKVNSIDFALLGMGTDGHVGSIFPFSKEVDANQPRIVRTEKKYKGAYRISFSIDMINQCAFKLLLVKGQEKYVLLQEKNKNYPINLIKGLVILYYAKARYHE